MRERDKGRDRVELSLDNRQIFVLFSSAAVVVGLVFALGVVVGKRLVPSVPDKPASDALELLDQLAGDDLERGELAAVRDQADAGAPGRMLTSARSPDAASGLGRDEARGEATGGGEQRAGVYALQLSSFQDRLEAEQFVRTLAGNGLTPRVVATQIPGRGTWYRVRIGNFASWDEAVRAKEEFERAHNLVAYVAREVLP